MTNATNDCTGCPVSAGTHKPADAVHTEIAEPGAPAVPEPWGACVGGRIWIGKLPDHVHKLAAQEGVAIQWLYTEQQVRTLLAAGVPAAAPDARDAEFFRWLTDDHKDAEVRMACSSIIDRMHVMTASAIRSDVASAIAAQAGKGVA